MNPYSPQNNTASNIIINSPINSGVKSVLDANNPNNVLIRPIRMQQMQPNDTNNISNQPNYQEHQLQSGLPHPPNLHIHPQQQQQSNTVVDYSQQRKTNIQKSNMQSEQNILLQNYPQQYQNNYKKSDFFVKEDSDKFQINPINKANISKESNHGEKLQMAPQVQLSDSRQSRSFQINNQNSGIAVNHTQPSNCEKSENLRISNDGMQQNLQSDNSDNYITRYIKHSPMKPLSDMNTNSINMNKTHLKLNQTTPKTQFELQTEHSQNSPKSNINRKSDFINSESEFPSGSEFSSTKSNLFAEKDEGKDISKRNYEKVSNSGNKIKQISQEKNKTNLGHDKDDGITSGIVRKNIKFFENNDTAKIPLTPAVQTVRKRERVTDTRFDVVKSEFYKDEYESGVDETPMVFANLGTIFQAPRKVAKISRKMTNKHQLKYKSEKICKSTLSSKSLKNKVHAMHFTRGTGKPQKIKTFGSNEELLAFFENSKSWRKFIRYGKSNIDQNATKDKVVYKPTTNGDFISKKTPSKLPAPSKINPPTSPTKSPLKSPGTPRSKSLPKTPESTASSTPLIKKVPMNKIQVGAAPSPNLKTVKSKIGSLANTTHKPGGGNVKIETHKIDLSKAQPRIEAKNDQYKPSGGDKKIAQVKLQWSAKSKIGSLENTTYKPGGGDKKIENIKLDFKEKAKPKVGSKDNVKHVPGGGNIKIENQKLEFKAQSKVGSLDNVKHKPGGGDIKIFDDKTYLRQVPGNCSEGRASGTQVLKSFKKLHRTRQSVFKNNIKVLDTVRKEINDKYKENKNVSDGDSIEELIKFASDVTYELKTTVAEFEEVTPGRYRLKLRPEMFEEQETCKLEKLSK